MVSASLFLRALLVQGAAVVVLFALLVAAPLPEDLFRDYGLATGPLAWLLCTLLTARVLALPLRVALLAAVAGGVAGALVLALGSHTGGTVAALLAFAAVCANNRSTSPTG